MNSFNGQSAWLASVVIQVNVEVLLMVTLF